MRHAGFYGDTIFQNYGRGTGVTVIHCEYFKVRCDSTGVSCEQCVVRTRALEQEAKRARVEARRRERVEEARIVLSAAT
jgi:hypothetical protein